MGPLAKWRGGVGSDNCLYIYTSSVHGQGKVSMKSFIVMQAGQIGVGFSILGVQPQDKIITIYFLSGVWNQKEIEGAELN